MPTNVRIHVAAGGLLLVLITVIALFWSFPKLLVYALLAIVAALAYGALYLILAAWMDPKVDQPTPVDVPPPTASDVTQPDLTVPELAPRKPARKPRKKAKKKSTTRKKKTKKTT